MAYTRAYVSGFRKTACDLGLSVKQADRLLSLEKSAGWRDWVAATKNVYRNGRQLIGTAKQTWDATPGDSPMDKLQYLAKGFGTMARVGNAIDSAKNAVSGFSSKLSGFWNNLGPDARRALIGALAAGAIPMLFGSGGFGRRLLDSTAAAGLGGLGMYGLSRSGYYDKAIPAAQKSMQYLTDRIGALKNPNAQAVQ